MEIDKSVKYTCVVDTTYTLALYILLQSDEAIKSTAFFVGNAIPQTVSSLLPNVIRIDNSNGKYTRIGRLKHRIEAIFRWRFRNNTIMYAQDHLAFSAHIIGRNNYILLEDAPRIYTNYKTIKFMTPKESRNFFINFIDYVQLGPIRKMKLGTNNKCVDRIVTSEKDLDSVLLKGKKYTLVNLSLMWKNASSEKQNLIKKMFGITDAIMVLPQKCSTIVFSQPLMEDCKLTEQEMLNLYDTYIREYLKLGIVIKPHPRDKFNYKKFYPDVEILNCKAPMQLLSAMGVDFKTAITVCSSAVSSMSEDAEIIWIGTHVNSKIYHVYGDIKCPR